MYLEDLDKVLARLIKLLEESTEKIYTIFDGIDLMLGGKISEHYGRQFKEIFESQKHLYRSISCAGSTSKNKDIGKEILLRARERAEDIVDVISLIISSYKHSNDEGDPESRKNNAWTKELSEDDIMKLEKLESAILRIELSLKEQIRAEQYDRTSVATFYITEVYQEIDKIFGDGQPVAIEHDNMKYMSQPPQDGNPIFYYKRETSPKIVARYLEYCEQEAARKAEEEARKAKEEAQAAKIVPATKESKEANSADGVVAATEASKTENKK